MYTSKYYKEFEKMTVAHIVGSKIANTSDCRRASSELKLLFEVYQLSYLFIRNGRCYHNDLNYSEWTIRSMRDGFRSLFNKYHLETIMIYKR